MIIIYKDYNRDEVEKDKKVMYIFTDNIHRTSGHIAIGDWNWYGQKFGKTCCHPNSTTSQIRGLDNAYPICIQKACYANGSFEGGQWKDTDFNEFKKYLDEDIKRIKDNMSKYKYIVFPKGGLFNRPISQINLKRTPKIYKYLLSKLMQL